jgi:hydroxymethylpyrimidine/phosphomethylpyrimidine kinase
MKTYPRVLTIAGSDSGGGAGIQADIKSISATGSYAASAITAVTVQNTLGVEAVHPVPAGIIAAQIRCVLSDIGADAIKIGMLHSAEVVLTVRKELRDAVRKGWLERPVNIVLDPVMVSTSGHRLIENDAIRVLSRELLPMARVITPNIPEAEILAGIRIHSQEDLPAIARKLSNNGTVSVLLKAGHLTEDTLTDVFYNAETDHILELTQRRLQTPNTHGTGCTLSSAFASYLAQGLSLDDAARAATGYIHGAIVSGAGYQIGHGHGPVDHFYRTR